MRIFLGKICVKFGSQLLVIYEEKWSAKEKSLIVKARIEEELLVIEHCQKKFRSEYEDLGVKFAVIEEKIEDSAKEVQLARSYVEDMYDRLLK